MTTQALVIPVSEREIPYALRVARATRDHGVQTEVDVSGHGVGAGLRLAAKRGLRLALIVGEEEQRQNVVTIRDLLTGEEQRAQFETLALHLPGEEGSL